MDHFKESGGEFNEMNARVNVRALPLTPRMSTCVGPLPEGEGNGGVSLRETACRRDACTTGLFA